MEWQQNALKNQMNSSITYLSSILSWSQQGFPLQLHKTVPDKGTKTFMWLHPMVRSYSSLHLLY